MNPIPSFPTLAQLSYSLWESRFRIDVENVPGHFPLFRLSYLYLTHLVGQQVFMCESVIIIIVFS